MAYLHQFLYGLRSWGADHDAAAIDRSHISFSALYCCIPGGELVMANLPGNRSATRCCWRTRLDNYDTVMFVSGVGLLAAVGFAVINDRRVRVK